ncbi:MAG: phosphate ABC transporter permease subunit PstC [Candidatus Latescibacterota bacterium]|nr:MAG: phosphate ABC transporter permease subunit PstC [Candidatus Latescibacterota bacterium]HDI00639.1 phosphate ABC transporter permease subunit PstC [Bacillota bacterium]
MRDNLVKHLLLSCASLSIVFLAGITVTLFKEGLPIFKEVSVFKFLFGRYWYPTYDPPDFGILPLILGSLWVTLGALFVAVPLGVGSAMYISELAHPKLREILKPTVELLASVPSVVYGFFGMVFLGPLVQRLFDLPVGLTCFTASIILGMMALPTVASIAEDAISAVPRELREASYALGAMKWETITKVVVPAASSGIIAAVILGFGRAVGETMTVLMVAGGAAVIPRSVFQPVRTMTATIAAEMGEAPMGSDHYHALFGIALVLFFITLGFNLLADKIIKG